MATRRRKRAAKARTSRPRARVRRKAERAPLPALTVLRLGAEGPAVVRLQERLAERGFSPGRIDGEFGRGTEAAVLAFQRSEGLLPDSIAGPRTLAALGLAADPVLPSAVSQLTVQVVASMCPAAPLGNIKAHLPRVTAAMVEHDLVDKPMLLMAVATIRAESAGFAPIDEYVSRFNTSPGADPPYFDLYDYRRDLGNLGPPDGAQFKGRGFIQLTGRDNYSRYGALLGLGDGLVRAPEMANDPAIAARLLARFLKDRERLIKLALLEENYAQARKWVNGGVHGLREFTEAYQTGARLIT